MTHCMALREAATSTFEELSFLLPTPGMTALQQAAPAAAEVVVAFTGDRAGSLTVTVFGELLPELAANMLGCLEPPAPALQRDALGEIANVICGNVLPLTEGVAGVFRLAAPQVREGRGTPDASEAVTLGFVNGRVELRLRFDDVA